MRQSQFPNDLGTLIGHAVDKDVCTGVSVLRFLVPARASVAVMGGAPGTRETDLLAPHQTVEQVHAIVFSGGSAFGLSAASGVQQVLQTEGVGLPVGNNYIPIVPQAIIFDMDNGGNKNIDLPAMYMTLGAEAANKCTLDLQCGSVGAGLGATTGNLMGGFGWACETLNSGELVYALVVVNALGQATVADSGQFWAEPFCQAEDAEFVTNHSNRARDSFTLKGGIKPDALRNTSLAAIVTNAPLSKAQCQRVATVAHDGIARALWPAHTPFDGDVVFALSTADATLGSAGTRLMMQLSIAAPKAVSRAIVKAVYHASPSSFGTLPSWAEAFAGADKRRNQ